MSQMVKAMGAVWCMTADAFESSATAMEAWIKSGCREAKGVMYAPRRVQAGTGREPKSIAVLPLYGMIAQHGSMFLDWIGGTSTEQFAGAFAEAMADQKVKAIVIDANTPGGQVSGTPELADKIYRARGEKPIISVASSLAASAGYYIASAADKMYVTPSGYVGSVGVLSIHEDYSKMLENDGVKVTITRMPKYKAEGNPYEPASEEFLASEASDIGRIYEMFVGDVAKYRGKTSPQVKADFGQGRIVDPKAALAAGMVDGIATFEEVVRRVSSNQIRIESGRKILDEARWKLSADSVKRS